DALALSLPPSAPPPPPLPCAGGGAAHSLRGQSPLRQALLPSGDTSRAGDSPSRSRSCLHGCCHFGWLPLAGGLAVVGRPFAGGPWLQSAAPLQVVGRPCKGAGRGHARLPLARASFAMKMQQECVE
ncbi:hypothetical protein B296_00006073, partial [Ensete ventricosum]